MPEKGRQKPGPKPTGRTVKPVGVALSPADRDFLERISDEQWFVTGGWHTEGLEDSARWSPTSKPRPSLSAVIRLLIHAERVHRSETLQKGHGRGEWYYYIVGPTQEDGRSPVEFRHLVTGETRRGLVNVSREIRLPPADAPAAEEPPTRKRR